MNVPEFVNEGLRRLRRLRVRSSAVACWLALAASPSAALAHITISPSSLPAGAEDELIFRCPDESANAATVKLVVQLPVDHPIASVKLRPIPGWRSRVTMRKLTVPISTDDGLIVAAVDTITWSGGRIEPGEYQDFAILAGPIPSGATELAFKAVQTYSDGEVARWIELRGPGEAEPAHPAPVLHVRASPPRLRPGAVGRFRRHSRAAAKETSMSIDQDNKDKGPAQRHLHEHEHLDGIQHAHSHGHGDHDHDHEHEREHNEYNGQTPSHQEADGDPTDDNGKAR